MASPLVEQFRSGSVAVELRLMAAQGALPLGPNDMVELLAHLTKDPEGSVRAASAKALSAFPPSDLLPVLTDRSTHPSVLAWAIECATDNDELRAAALQNKNAPDTALEKVASSLPESLAELVVINQHKLIHNITLVEALEANPHLEPDQRRRLREVREEFFDKVEAPPKPAPPPEPPPAPEPPAEPEPASEAEAIVRYLENGERSDASKVGAVQKLYGLTTAEKMLTALKGTREERSILIRDPNRLVWSSVLSSPKLTESEVESYASMKNISDQALRVIGSNREWTRHHGVSLGLVRNPRTPVGIALPLIANLTQAERKALAHDRNVSEAIRKAAGRFGPAK